MVLAMQLAVVLAQVVSVYAARLSMTGEGSTIVMNGATLTTRCDATTPSILYMNHTAGSHLLPASGVRLVLLGVPASCAGLPLTSPCASIDSARPRMFRCALSGGGLSTDILGSPTHAGALTEVRDGVSLGSFLVYVDCRLPSIAEHVVPGSASQNMTIRLYHAGVLVPFSGLEGGLHVAMGATYVDCADILANDPTATDGEYAIYPEGPSGSVLRVLCDMTSFGGGWTRFNWNNEGVAYPVNADPFGVELTDSSCDVTSDSCRGRVPAASITRVTQFMVSTTGPFQRASGQSDATTPVGAKAAWTFTFTTRISNAIYAAFRGTRTTSRIANGAAFSPTSRTSDSNGCVSTSCDSFWYESTGTNFDDDTGWGMPAFKMGNTGIGNSQCSGASGADFGYVGRHPCRSPGAIWYK